MITGAAGSVSGRALVIARCTVDYVGRLTAHLPARPRLMLVKADGRSHPLPTTGAYKPLNWMSPPCTLREEPTSCDGPGRSPTRPASSCVITIEEILHDSSHELGVDPGLVKDGVEAHLQALLAEQIETLGDGLAARPPRIPDRDRAGRHPLPRRRTGRRWRSRSSAAVRSTASSSSPAISSCSTATRARPGARHLRRPGDQAAGQGAGRRPRHPLRRRSTTTPCAASTTSAPASSS